MSNQIPDDANGDVLRRFIDSGDNLTEPRNVEFNHLFRRRSWALNFAKAVKDKVYTVAISYFEEEDGWDANVTIYMVPEHSEISRIESDLGIIADSCNGRSDGWLAQAITDK